MGAPSQRGARSLYDRRRHRPRRDSAARRHQRLLRHGRLGALDDSAPGGRGLPRLRARPTRLRPGGHARGVLAAPGRSVPRPVREGLRRRAGHRPLPSVGQLHGRDQHRPLRREPPRARHLLHPHRHLSPGRAGRGRGRQGARESRRPPTGAMGRHRRRHAQPHGQDHHAPGGHHPGPVRHARLYGQPPGRRLPRLPGLAPTHPQRPEPEAEVDAQGPPRRPHHPRHLPLRHGGRAHPRLRRLRAGRAAAQHPLLLPGEHRAPGPDGHARPPQPRLRRVLQDGQALPRAGERGRRLRTRRPPPAG